MMLRLTFPFVNLDFLGLSGVGKALTRRDFWNWKAIYPLLGTAFHLLLFPLSFILPQRGQDVNLMNIIIPKNTKKKVKMLHPRTGL